MLAANIRTNLGSYCVLYSIIVLYACNTYLLVAWDGDIYSDGSREVVLTFKQKSWVKGRYSHS